MIVIIFLSLNIEKVSLVFLVGAQIKMYGHGDLFQCQIFVVKFSFFISLLVIFTFVDSYLFNRE